MRTRENELRVNRARPSARRGSAGTVLLLVLLGPLLALALPAAEKAATTTPTATISVSGAGFFRDRELRLALNRLLRAELKAYLDSNAIEDAAVILVSALSQAGFQDPKVQIEATLTDGTEVVHEFDPSFAVPLPRPLSARQVRFRLNPGVRSHVEAIEFVGLSALPERQARAFFRTDATLVGTARTNAYSPGKLGRGVDGLLGELRQRGYISAQVKAEIVDETPGGAITLRVTVSEGRRWEVTAILYQRDEDDRVPLPVPEQWVGRPWSPTLQEDIREAIRQVYYREGFPDVGVHVEAEEAGGTGAQVNAEVVATLVSGLPVTVGQVRFSGRVATRESVLRRRVLLKSGDPLDPVMLERARYRIARLGVFDAVDLRYEPPEGEVRDPVFSVREGPRYETHLLFGYGSYEQLRVGVEHRQMNIFGLAHQSRLDLVQSLKSTSGDYSYTVPELFGESIDGTARLFGLQREEIAFTRQEFGLNVSLRHPVSRIGGDAKAGYTLQALRNRRNELSTQLTDESQILVASVNVGLFGDTRDNPLRPRRGYHWSMQLEAADPMFGGEATYQRLELAGAYHTNWGGGRWVHLGLAQGIIATGGSDDSTLPVNKRFYPGGDNSIRGYQRGEAAPRGADGLFIGAKAFLLLNLELEQALTPNWSVVAFVDALGTAVALRDLPFEERLYSVGLGVRYQTLIGPLRLEYGRNLEPRLEDPAGTWQFSIGYPF
jgi:outer membrane protein assembly factor BamA